MHNVAVEQYADDTQVFVELSTLPTTQARLAGCPVSFQ